MQIYAPGTLIGKYEIASKPMNGEMGVVYFCIDHGNNDRPVEIKTVNPEYIPDHSARDRFLREVTAWVELGRHPHIVRCYAVEYIEPTVFLSLELIAREQGRDDASLRSWMGAPMPVEQALLFALQIARGMKHATDKIPGFVHRDLKPEHVLVGEDKLPGTNTNRLRVTDFGLATILKDEGGRWKDEENPDDVGRTHLTHGIVGTPLYMAPEQWQGESLGAFTDIYALGCILFEMLNGQHAALGRKTSELQAAHCAGNLRPVPTEWPRTVRELLTTSLALRPQARPQSWEDFTRMLEQAYTAQGQGNAPEAVRAQAESIEERQQTGWSCNVLGESFLDMGKAQFAADYFKKSQVLACETGDRRGEAAALGNLGNAYLNLGDPHRAIEFYDQALLIHHEIGNRRGEGNVLGNLGSAYLNLSDPRRAIEFYEQALLIHREIGDRCGEAATIGNMGTAYKNLGDPHHAIEFYEQQLVITREIGDRRSEGGSIGNLGLAYAALGDLHRAIEFYEQALLLHREFEDRHSEGAAIGNLGAAYKNLGDPHRAIEFYEQQLVITREIGDRRGEGAAIGNLGTAYATLGDPRRAIEFYEQGLVIDREIGNRRGEGIAFGNLGVAYAALDDPRRAIGFYEQQFIITREIGDLMGLANGSGNLAILYIQQGEPNRALEYAQESVRLFTQIGHTQNAQRAQQLVDQLQGSAQPSQSNAAQQAFEAFQRADTPQAMQAAAAQNPTLKDGKFIQAIQNIIAEQVPSEQKPAFEKRLAWLRQIVQA